MVNVKDLTGMLNYLSGEETTGNLEAFDVNEDNRVNSKDCIRLLKIISGEMF